MKKKVVMAFLFSLILNSAVPVHAGTSIIKAGEMANITFNPLSGEMEVIEWKEQEENTTDDSGSNGDNKQTEDGRKDTETVEKEEVIDKTGTGLNHGTSTESGGNSTGTPGGNNQTQTGGGTETGSTEGNAEGSDAEGGFDDKVVNGTTGGETSSNEGGFEENWDQTIFDSIPGIDGVTGSVGTDGNFGSDWIEGETNIDTPGWTTDGNNSTESGQTQTQIPDDSAVSGENNNIGNENSSGDGIGSGGIGDDTSNGIQRPSKPSSSTIINKLTTKFDDLMDNSEPFSSISDGFSTTIVEKLEIDTSDLKDVIDIALEGLEPGDITVSYVKDKKKTDPNDYNLPEEEYTEILKDFMADEHKDKISIGSDFEKIKFPMLDDEEFKGILDADRWATINDFSETYLWDYKDIRKRYENIDKYINYVGLGTEVDVYHVIEYRIYEVETGAVISSRGLNDFNWYVRDATGSVISTIHTYNNSMSILMPNPGNFTITATQLKKQTTATRYSMFRADYLILADTGQTIWKTISTASSNNDMNVNDETGYVEIGSFRLIVTERDIAELWIDRAGNIIEMFTTERIE